MLNCIWLNLYGSYSLHYIITFGYIYLKFLIKFKNKHLKEFYKLTTLNTLFFFLQNIYYIYKRQPWIYFSFTDNTVVIIHCLQSCNNLTLICLISIWYRTKKMCIHYIVWWWWCQMKVWRLDISFTKCYRKCNLMTPMVVFLLNVINLPSFSI